jgi:hypothetical protein
LTTNYIIHQCTSQDADNKPTQKGNAQMYTAQIDAHGNVIVCRGDEQRRGYRIAYTGTYNECLMFKALRGQA